MTAFQYLCHVRPVGETIANQTKHFDTLQKLKKATAEHDCLHWFRHRVDVALARNYVSAKMRIESTIEREPCVDCPFDDTVSEYWVFCQEGLQVFRVCCLCNDLVYVTDPVNY